MTNSTPNSTPTSTPTSTTEFLGLEQTGEYTWRFPIAPHTTGGGGSLFGGAGLAAGILALEAASEQPVVWSTGQYIARTEVDSVLELTVELPAVGRTVTQGRVTGRIDGAEIITVLGAAGERDDVASGMWEPVPDAIGPDDSLIIDRSEEGDSIHTEIDIRMARGMFGFHAIGEPSGDHRTLLWARMRNVRHDSAALALLADYMPSALGNALGQQMNCTSLDNTIRFAVPCDQDPGEWVLLDNRIEFVGRGFAKGSALMWSESGELLATASQSMTVFLPRD